MDAGELAAFRREKDEVFAHHPHSPIPERERGGFTGLHYFPPEPRLALDLQVEPGDGEELTVATSDSEGRRYRRAGRISFEVEGEQVSLSLLASSHEEGYFLPFRDATSGKESYGAGRYLDVEAPVNGRVRVDFNRAYNPYCAYDEAYSCPLPPAENWLEVPIRAGEATYPG